MGRPSRGSLRLFGPLSPFHLIQDLFEPGLQRFSLHSNFRAGLRPKSPQRYVRESEATGQFVLAGVLSPAIQRPHLARELLERRPGLRLPLIQSSQLGLGLRRAK